MGQSAPVAITRDHIPTLDGWRAVAIILVLAHHFLTSFCAPEGPQPNPSLYAFGDTLAIGVDIFFVLSGYLICTRLLEERARWGRISLKAFYVRRAFRILPPYLLYMIVLGALAALGLVTFVGLDELFWGCALAALLQSPSLRRQTARLLSAPVYFLAVILLISCVWAQPHFELVWQSILLAALLAGTSLHPESTLGRLLEIPAIRWIGTISYSLYIWQQLFVTPYPHRLGWLQDAPWNFVAAFLCATASYYLLERPMMKKGKILAAR
jgi:peptidoglycan/LPS O-acetylase OafA/YrhL